MANEKTEKTPKGLEVPIPKRETFFDNLKRAAKPESASPSKRPDSDEAVPESSE